MISITSGTCLVGAELEGFCSGNSIRKNIKREIIILPKYNKENYVLEGFAKCKIINNVFRLTTEEFVVCLSIIRKNGYEPKESAGLEIKGKEISCECAKAYSAKRIFVFKSKIALATLNRSFSSGGTYEMSENYVGSPQFRLKN